MVPNYIPVIDLNKFPEDFVQSFYRNDETKANKALHFQFRIEISYYKENGDELYMPFYFSVIYYAPSNYVKVFYRKNNSFFASIEDYKKEALFTKIADHDSCWRDCWGDIYKDYHNSLDIFISKNNLEEVRDKLSYYCHIEKIEEITIADTIHTTGMNSYDDRIAKFILNKDNTYNIVYQEEK